MAEAIEPAAGASPSDEAVQMHRARLILWWERLWPRLAPPLCVLACFVAVSWFGLFERLPGQARLGLLLVFIAGLALAARPLWQALRPSDQDVLARLDKAAGIAHRPVSALHDAMVQGAADPFAQALWRAHQQRLRERIGRLRLGLPKPGLPALDRYALRAVPLIALFVSFFVAGEDRLARLASAFTAPPEVIAVQPVRIDAWVTPPLYTRRPPQTLSTTGSETVSVPQGSLLVVRVAGDDKAAISASGEAGPVAPAASTVPSASAVPDPAAPAVLEQRYVLTGATTVTVARGGQDAAKLRFAVIPDKAPTIEFAGPIKSAARGAMTLTYRIEDDYGAVGAEAQLALPEVAGAHPLYEAPKLPLAAPANHARSATVTATRDLSEHPFAGATLKMTLIARDDAGNEGRSAPREDVLPGRFFVNPLARALIEQRRKLALDANQAGKVREALSALLIDPQTYTPKPGIYLGLRSAYLRLDRAHGDKALREVVDYLWAIALHIEDGSTTQAERELKAAQERLREALERGAPPEEIARLTQELRQAMTNFLKDYQEALRRSGKPPQEAKGDEQVVSPEELQAMLDRMEEMNRNGDREAAQQLLSELNDILENLAPADQGETADNGQSQEMEKRLGDLGKIVKRQQKLRDKTFRGDRAPGDTPQGDGQQDQSRNSDPPAGGQGDEQDQGGRDGQDDKDGQGGKGLEGLRGDQKGLRQDLQALRKQLEELGAQPGPNLEEGEKAMREAEGQLGKGDRDGAVGSQGRALEALRKGAQELARQLAESQRGAPGGPRTRTGRGPPGPGNDPLGRPTRNRNYSDGNTKVPGRNESALERAGRVMEELRRRFADPSRPQPELDYIERLLRP